MTFNSLIKSNIQVEPAYKNLSLNDIPGEKWVTIIGFEDRYEISSFGRIKSLPRVLVCNGGEFSTKERILKVVIRKLKNIVVNDFKTTTYIALSNTVKVRKTMSIGRLVYYHFVGYFDLNDYQHVVSYKDGNGLNIHPENLFLSTISDLGREVYTKGRNKSELSLKSRPVGQFDIKGNFIAQFASCYQAARMTGFKSSGISFVARGNTYLFRGYIWQYGEVDKLYPEKLIGSRNGTLNFSQMLKFGINVPCPRQLAIFNLDLKDMPGEEWKFLPGYNEKYMISNLGRIKSMRRIADGIKKKWLPETILRLHIKIKDVKAENKTPSSVMAKFRHYGNTVTLYVARWVYFLFVKEFDIENRSMCVYYKDLDSLNLFSENLFIENSYRSFNFHNP